MAAAGTGKNGLLTTRPSRRRWRRGEGWPTMAAASSNAHGGARGGGALATATARGGEHRVEDDTAMPAVWSMAEVLHCLRR